MPDIACELKLPGAELRAELTAAITQSEARMRAYVDRASAMATLLSRLA